LARYSLRRLLCELDGAKVGNIYLESREAKQNGRDLPLLDALRAENAISPRGLDGPARPSRAVVVDI
jgi:hypothetical protein